MRANSPCLVVGVNGNLVTGATDTSIAMNEIAYILVDDGDKRRANIKRLRSRNNPY